MKFSVNDEVRVKYSTNYGVILETEYVFKVINGSSTETKRYLVLIDGKRTAKWFLEEELIETAMAGKKDLQTDLTLLDIQIDEALKKKDKESFMAYSKIRNDILNKTKDRQGD